MGCETGKGCIINPQCRFGGVPFLISIGNDCVLSGDNTFITHDGAIRISFNSKDFKEIGTLFGPIAIRNNCFIEFGVRILPNVITGPNSVVGARSVVTKNVPPNTIYAGSLSKFISTYDEYKKKMQNEKYWNYP